MHRMHEHFACIGTLVVGDLNVHNTSWLTHSSGTSPEGKLLRGVARGFGLTQLVDKPTRGRYLLDLVLTDIENASVEVLPRIADHSLVLTTVRAPVKQDLAIEREVWQLHKADWDMLDDYLAEHDWRALNEAQPDDCA